MLSIKLVRSLVLGETMTTTTTRIHDDNEEDEEDKNGKIVKKKKLPMLLFIPTKELITDTFRLATITRHLGMNFYPSPSLSHLLFSWPSPNNNVNIININNNINYRNSVSSQTSTFTHTSITSSITSMTSSSSLQNDAVPIPFPTLSTSSSISLLRSFISLSKGFFKLVFIDPNPNPNLSPNYVDYDTIVQFGLFSRVSGKRVRSIDELSRELAGKGWSLYRSKGDLVYLFRKTEANRVRVRVGGGGGEGGSRVRELRLGRLDFEKGVNFRVLLYILLITDDVFYLA